MSLRAKLIIALAAAVIVRLGFYLLTGFTADDAFITFRYAENMASGFGMVYNTGERVLGTSTPFFTWLLATTRNPGPMTALIISLLCSGLTAVVLYKFATVLRFGSLAWLPAAAYVLWPRSVPADTSGMETALFTMLITAAFYCHKRRLLYYAVGFATLATLTRPEGGLLLLLLFTASVYRDRVHWKSYTLTWAALIVPWLVLANFYFGSPLPHSIPAKLALYSQFGTDSWWQNLVYLMGWHNPVGFFMVISAVIGGIWLNRKQNFGTLEAVWLAGTIGFFTFGSTHLFFWYVAPIYPIYLLFACASVVWTVDRSATLKAYQFAVTTTIAVVLVAVLSVGLYRQYDHYRSMQAYSDTVLVPVARYLSENVDVPNEVVAAEDIGHIGYFSRCRILDRDGLVSPIAVPFNRDGRYLDLVLDVRPEWVGAGSGSPISRFVTDPMFLKSYARQKTFGDDPEAQYHVYRRVD